MGDATILHYARNRHETACGESRRHHCATENADIFENVKAGKILPGFRKVCPTCAADVARAGATGDARS